MLVSFNVVFLIDVFNFCSYLLIQLLCFLGFNDSSKANFELLAYKNKVRTSKGVEGIANFKRRVRGGIYRSLVARKLSSGKVGIPIPCVLFTIPFNTKLTMRLVTSICPFISVWQAVLKSSLILINF